MCAPTQTIEPTKQESTLVEQIGSLAFANWLWNTPPALKSIRPATTTAASTRVPEHPRPRSCSYDRAAEQQHPRHKQQRLSLLREPSSRNCLCESAHPKRRRSFCNRRNLLLLISLVGLVVAVWFVWAFLSGASYDDVKEIDAIVKKLSISDQEQEKRLLEIKESLKAGNAPSHRILVAGLVESLQDLHENDPVISAITSLCWVYSGNDSSGSHPMVDVRILYKHTKTDDIGKSTESGSMDDDERVLSLHNQLTGWGCRTSLESEEVVWQGLKGAEKEKAMKEFQELSRYKRLAKLRSFHRRHILSTHGNEDYAVVMNADMDIVHLPPVLAMLNAMDRVVSDRTSGAGSVICANGFETWRIGDMRRQMFYDTLAAVEANGDWAYSKYTTNPVGVLKFAQNTFLRDILRHERKLWPMQSCFGGVALYDYATWATPECDYDQDNIQFVQPFHTQAINSSSERLSRRLRAAPSHALKAQLHRQKWTLDPGYFQESGDACEHVVFQQCLYHHNRAQSQGDLRIGIQPDLIIQREAAVLGRPEDVARVALHAGKLVMALTALSLMAFPILKMLQRVGSKHQQLFKAKMKRVHEA